MPVVLTYDEVEKLLNMPDIEKEVGARDNAIFEMLYATGIRVSEACNLHINDVNDEYIK